MPVGIFWHPAIFLQDQAARRPHVAQRLAEPATREQLLRAKDLAYIERLARLLRRSPRGPTGHIKLLDADYAWRARLLTWMPPVVATLEGGYSVPDVAR